MNEDQARGLQRPGDRSRIGVSSKPSDDELLTVAEVAQWLKLSPKVIYAWAAKGKIPRVRISNRVRFLRCDVLRWIEARKEG